MYNLKKLYNIRPNYSNPLRYEQIRIRTSYIPVEYKNSDVLLIGDAEGKEKEYLEKGGFTSVYSTDAYYPFRKDGLLDIEKERLGRKFDLIFTSHTLEHCVCLFDALFNIRKMLKDNGEVFVFTPNEIYGWSKPYHYYSFSLEGWKNVFKRAFLKAVRAEEVDVIDRKNYFFILKKIKIGAIVRCYHLTDYLEKVLNNLKWVDKIVLANYRYKGVEAVPDDTRQIAEKLELPNLVILSGEDKEQYEVFNEAMKEFSGFDYVFINDADEIVLPNDQLKIIYTMLESGKDAGVIKVLDYAIDFYHRYPVRTHHLIIIVKPTAIWKDGEKRTPDYGEGVVFDDIYLHHFGYIVKDMKWKVKNAWHTNKKEIEEMTSREYTSYQPPAELLRILGVRDE